MLPPEAAAPPRIGETAAASAEDEKAGASTGVGGVSVETIVADEAEGGTTISAVAAASPARTVC